MVLVRLPDAGVPNAGVTSVGDVANTNAPVPVSSVIAEIKLDELGVAKNVATPEPNPETPVLTETDGVAKLNVPLPSVCNTCPLVPSAEGSVHTRLVPTVTGALKPT